MARINWAIDGGSSASEENAEGFELGTLSDIINDSPAGEDTVYTGSDLWSRLTDNPVGFDLTVSFAAAHTITEIGVIFSWSANGGVDTGHKYLDYYDGSWHNVASVALTGGSPAGDLGYWNVTGTWSNVSKIRYRIHVTASIGDLNGVRVEEFRGWGPTYLDVGLRLRSGAGTLTLGCEALNGHHLRIRKGGTTYGIPLIDTGGAEDSGLRIFDGSSVKTVPKI